MKTMISPDVRKALAVGQAHHWAFQFIGYGEAPVEPTRMGGWVVETATEVPEKARERLSALLAAGVPVTHVIVAHEAPKLLGSPAKKPDFKTTPIVPNVEKPMDTFVQVAGGIFGVIALVIQMLFIPLLLIDPAVIIRLPGGEMLVVTTWVE